VRGLVRPLRHILRRQVRQRRQKFVDLLASLGRRPRSFGFGCLVMGSPLHQLRCVATRLFRLPYFTRELVPHRSRFLNLCFEVTPSTIQQNDSVGTRRQAAPLQRGVERRGIVANGAKIVHLDVLLLLATIYRHPALQRRGWIEIFASFETPTSWVPQDEG